MPSRLAVLRCRLTAEHIRDGIPRNARWCPIALAILAAHPDIWQVRVERPRIRWTDRSTGIRYEIAPMPPRLLEWHSQYDEHGGAAVSPIRFQLRATAELPPRHRAAPPRLPQPRWDSPAYSTTYRPSLSELAAIGRAHELARSQAS